ncbi:hypothetical protein V9T40_001312 [Parthenolecanium corni]|uniref:Uncharacterized protein n=1 Tax=Parthenolecanium corni TaxID=536013 RepID=A0AAN9TF16_9HEMI
MSIHLLRTYRPALNSYAQAMRYNVFRTTESKRCMSFSRKFASKPAISWKSVLVAGTLTGAIVYWMRELKAEKERREAIERKVRLGKAAIGGPFELIDSEGKLRNSEEFKGQWLLIYFGFTHCPDICPDEIEKMVKTVDVIEKNEFVPNIQPIFISVDPERDTPEIVGKYIKEFSPKFIGLTGSKEQVDKVCKAYRVYYSAGPQDEDKDYIVDHTIIIYLINPEGEFVDYYGQTRGAEEVANGIEFQMLKYDKLNKPASILIPSFLTKNSSNSQSS